MGKSIKDYKTFYKVSEQEEEKPFRLYGEGGTDEADLINQLKRLIKDINSANPKDQESYDLIKEDIKSKTLAIKRHKNFEDFKKGFNWQDTFIKLSDWESELKNAVYNMASKAAKRGLA